MRLGLTVGPVPTRVDADVKAGLLDLVDHATEHGWSTRRAAEVLQISDDRLRRWDARRAVGEPLDDASPGPEEPLHALPPAERTAIISLYDQWSDIDRSHRKLAHRGSREELVWVSESTVWRVLKAEGLVIPETAPRGPTQPKRPWPEWVEYRPCQVWGHDFSAFMPADTDALAILDLVSRKWITTLLTGHGHGTAETITAAYTAGLTAEGLMPVIEQRMIQPNSDEELPVLLAVSVSRHGFP
jgi:putative transposase